MSLRTRERSFIAKFHLIPIARRLRGGAVGDGGCSKTSKSIHIKNRKEEKETMKSKDRKGLNKKKRKSAASSTLKKKKHTERAIQKFIKQNEVVGAVRVAVNANKRSKKRRIITLPSITGGDMSSLPNRALSNHDIEEFIQNHKIPHFRGVFMRDNLPTAKPWKYECMVVNHDSVTSFGTHWTCFVKTCTDVIYFDSFGKLPPPLELVAYLGSDCQIYYNVQQYQQFNTIICGHLCLSFLYDYYRREENK